jgi:hypothetical protein
MPITTFICRNTGQPYGVNPSYVIGVTPEQGFARIHCNITETGWLDVNATVEDVCRFLNAPEYEVTIDPRALEIDLSHLSNKSDSSNPEPEPGQIWVELGQDPIWSPAQYTIVAITDGWVRAVNNCEARKAFPIKVWKERLGFFRQSHSEATQ